jgi:hypothetical protein
MMRHISERATSRLAAVIGPSRWSVGYQRRRRCCLCCRIEPDRSEGARVERLQLRSAGRARRHHRRLSGRTTRSMTSPPRLRSSRTDTSVMRSSASRVRQWRFRPGFPAESRAFGVSVAAAVNSGAACWCRTRESGAGLRGRRVRSSAGPLPLTSVSSGRAGRERPRQSARETRGSDQPQRWDSPRTAIVPAGRVQRVYLTCA